MFNENCLDHMLTPLFLYSHNTLFVTFTRLTLSGFFFKLVDAVVASSGVS